MLNCIRCALQMANSSGLGVSTFLKKTDWKLNELNDLFKPTMAEMSSSRFKLVCSNFVILLKTFVSITHSAFFMCNLKKENWKWNSFGRKHFVSFICVFWSCSLVQTQKINQIICDLSILLGHTDFLCGVWNLVSFKKTKHNKKNYSK